MKKKGILILSALAVFVLCVVVAAVFREKDVKASGEGKKTQDISVITEGSSMVISTSEITEEATFIPVEVDATQMEVIAVRGSSGEIRTAFNTCQICYGSGRGYYVQDGKFFVCQNCGNRFTVDDIEIKSGGCNPWPIFEEDKTVTGETIEISYDFFVKSEDIFKNWKNQFK